MTYVDGQTKRKRRTCLGALHVYKSRPTSGPLVVPPWVLRCIGAVVTKVVRIVGQTSAAVMPLST